MSWLEKILGSPAPRSNAVPRGISPTPEERQELASSLSIASSTGDVEEARQLLASGAEPSCRGEFGATPLHRAAEQGHTVIASLLLSHGAEVNERDDAGDTPLLCACRMGRAKVARVLLAAGGDAALCNKQGSNSLDAALEAREMLGLVEVSELLLGIQREGAAGFSRGAAPASGSVGLRSLSSLDTLSASSVDHASAGSLQAAGAETGGSAATTPRMLQPSVGGGGVGDGAGGGGGLSMRAYGSGGAPLLALGSTRLRLRREEWALDRNYPNCHLCKEQFTIFNR